MNIEPVAMFQGGAKTNISLESETIKEKREQYSGDKATKTAPAPENKNVQPEELLQHIKALTEDGLFHVRFELHDASKELVINLIDQESGEVIRQIPSEEILGLHMALADLRGNFIETES